MNRYKNLIILLATLTFIKTLAVVDAQLPGIGDDLSQYNLTTPQLCARDNYTSETHTVVTQDKYILTLHRITGSPLLASPRVNKPVVLLMHGLLASSSCWLLNAPGKRLAYLLVDQGYDVWMGNARGNMYSRSHLTLSPDDPEFWDFSYHESGVYDMPATIDYILAQTGQPKLNYIGHSMGTTVFFVMCAEKPEYNSKINYMIALAPAAFFQYMKGPLRVVASLLLPGFESDLIAQLGSQGKGEYSPSEGLLQKFKTWGCQNYVTQWALCTTPLFLQYGFDPSQVDPTIVPDMMGHYPQGSSVYTVIHQAQGVNSGHFRQYDHGLFENILEYGSIFPPDYDLTQITAPVYLISGLNDWLADATDVMILSTKLLPTTLKGNVRVNYTAWNHGDFIIALDVNTLLHPKIFQLLRQANP